MAYLEAAVIVYLRQLYGISDVVRDVSLHPDSLASIELGREAATLLMLGALGWLAGWEGWSRVGGFLFAFGLWDLAYYGWLRVFIGWPRSFSEWDLLFLIPVPWWGPVWAPVLAAMLLVAVGGGLVLRVGAGSRLRADRWTVGALVLGAGLALFSVWDTALAGVGGGWEAVAEARPESFAWPFFVAGWALVACGGWRALRVA